MNVRVRLFTSAHAGSLKCSRAEWFEKLNTRALESHSSFLSRHCQINKTAVFGFVTNNGRAAVSKTALSNTVE